MIERDEIKQVITAADRRLSTPAGCGCGGEYAGHSSCEDRALIERLVAVLRRSRAVLSPGGAAEKDTHRCSGCGHQWEGPLQGAELCGDCWRKGQAAIFGAAEGRSRAVLSAPESWLKDELAAAAQNANHYALSAAPKAAEECQFWRGRWFALRDVQSQQVDALGEAGASRPDMPEPLRTHLGWLLTKIRNNPDYPEARGIWERYTDWQDSVMPPTDTARPLGEREYRAIPLYGGGLIWGVVGPRMLPCLAGTKADAEELCDSDERVALFRVEEVQAATSKDDR